MAQNRSGVQAECQHLSRTGDEGPIEQLGRWPVKWRCDACGDVRRNEPLASFYEWLATTTFNGDKVELLMNKHVVALMRFAWEASYRLCVKEDIE